MQLVKGNSRSTISTQGDYQAKILVLNYHSLRTNPKQIASDIDLDYGKTSQEQVRKYPYMNLGAETNLQSQRHNRGQTTLGLDYSSVSPKQLTSDFSYWDKMSILQITF